MYSKKKLPVSEPLTNTWLYDAFPLSILAANGNKYLAGGINEEHSKAGSSFRREISYYRLPTE